MGMTSSKLSSLPARFQVGAYVEFTTGLAKWVGRIVEDRGPLGVGGRRLYGISFPLDAAEPSYTERPEEDLTEVSVTK